MRIILLGIITISTLCFSAATITKGSKQRVNFDSKPIGAIIRIDGISTCQTPCSIRIKTSARNKFVTIEKDGYETMRLTMNSEFAEITVLSLLWDLGTTDFITGAAWEYTPYNYFFELNKNNN